MPSKKPYTIKMTVPPSLSEIGDRQTEITITSEKPLNVVLIGGQLLTVLANLEMNKPIVEILP